MEILVTGSTGQLGRAVVPRLLAKGHRLTLLARDPARALAIFPGCSAVRGDVAEPGLGLAAAPRVDAVLHMAADVNLGSARDARVRAVNYGGTVAAAAFCLRAGVRRLFYAGTAYTEKGRNAYERSKKEAEAYLAGCAVPEKTIFKIGILVPGEDEARTACDGAFYRFVSAAALAIDRGGLRGGLFRIRGLAGAAVNLVPADAVAAFMAELPPPGTYWLTHPSPPRVAELAAASEPAIGAKVSIEEDFRMSPAEAVFHRLSRAFLPYLRGDDFPSDLRGLPPLKRAFLEESIAASVARARAGAGA